MKKSFHVISILIISLTIAGTNFAPAFAHQDKAGSFLLPTIAFWVWTPESNKWINPKYAVKDTPQEQLQAGIDLYGQKEYKAAIAEFEKLIKHYPLARQAPDAQYHIGLCFDDQGNLFRAFKEYQVVIDKYPFSDLAATIVQKQYDIGLKMLEGASGRNKFIKAMSGGDYNVIDVFRAVIKNAPYGTLAAPAQYKIGLYLQEQKMFQESRDEFEKVINDYPDSEWAKAAKYQIAISDAKRSTDAQYDQKVTQVAVAEFKEFVENYPDAELSASAKEEIR